MQVCLAPHCPLIISPPCCQEVLEWFLWSHALFVVYISFETTSLCHHVATLALGSRPRQGGCKVAGQVGNPWALHMFPRVQRMWGNEPSHSQVNSHVGSWSPERTLKSSERNCRGQISLPWRVFYIIGKVLKCRCPKWPRMSHLDVCSPSYGQKKGRESKLSVWEKMTPDQKKSEIDPIYLASGDVPHIVGKISTRATTLLQTALQSEVCRRSYAPYKVPGVLVGGISGLPRGSPEREKPFGCRPRGESQSIL